MNGFVNINLSESINEKSAGFPARKPVPAGSYTLTILEAGIRNTKKGGQALVIKHEIVGHAKAPWVWQWLTFGKAQTQFFIRKYMSLLGVDYTGDPFDWKSLPGWSFDAELSVRPAQGKWPAKNEIVLPAFPRKPAQDEEMPATITPAMRSIAVYGDDIAENTQ